MSLPEAPNFEAILNRVEGRSVLRWARRDWQAIMGEAGRPIAIDVKHTPLGRVAAQAVATIAGPHAPGASRIEIYRYDPKDAATPINKDTYLVIEDTIGWWDLATIVISASTEDNANLRDYLKLYVFLVKEDPGPDHWLSELPATVVSIIRRA